MGLKKLVADCGFPKGGTEPEEQKGGRLNGVEKRPLMTQNPSTPPARLAKMLFLEEDYLGLGAPFPDERVPE
jgi:hypothetical protein